MERSSATSSSSLPMTGRLLVGIGGRRRRHRIDGARSDAGGEGTALRRQTPRAVEWLSDNGSPFTAKETLDFAVALGLVPCFTPVHSPESSVIPCWRTPIAGCCYGAPVDRQVIQRLQRE